MFEPALMLKGGAVVRTLDDAIAFLVGYKKAHWPLLLESTLRRLEGLCGKATSLSQAHGRGPWQVMALLRPTAVTRAGPLDRTDIVEGPT
jgi:hypothetical protein